MKKFREIIVEARPFNPDLLSGILWELNLKGITEEENKLIIYSDSSDISIKKEVKRMLNNLIENNLIKSFNISERLLENKNWNELWERQLDIIKVSERIIIKPPTKEYSAGQDQIVIIIEPKMSFGTGEHETTKLVLRLLEKYIRK